MFVLQVRGGENLIEVFIDGGIRRATDIIKVLCRGRRGVGIRRPFLYAMSAYGLHGVDRAMQSLKDEIEMNLTLVACSSIDQLRLDLEDARGLATHNTNIPIDRLAIFIVSGPSVPR
jgi:L-lactate dehydrogenase (cytochrome)